jgi:hypothetical protein
MPLNLTDLPVFQRVLQEMEVERKKQQRWTFIARTSLLSIKPIVSKDPEIFKAAVEQLQRQNPGLNIYLFEVEGL